MATDYSKDMYRQMMELFDKVDALTATIEDLKREHKEEVAEKETQIDALKKKVEKLEAENSLLHEEVSRLKSDRNNNSGNSSNPPSSDRKGFRKANEYNGRKKSGKKQGAQQGHKGKTLTKAEAEKMIGSGKCRHIVKEIGDSRRGKYTVKYEIDVSVETEVTEYRIYAGARTPNMPDGEVYYGPKVKALAVELYGIGVVSFLRIGEIIRSITGKMIDIAAGTLYGFCCKFAEKGKASLKQIEEHLLDSGVVYTDATVMTINGEQAYVRNMSSEDCVRYYGMAKKDLETLNAVNVLTRFAGILVHDHETAIYHFGIGHGECNTHLIRYLLKNTEDSSNSWSGKLSSLLLEMKGAREKAESEGRKSFSERELAEYYRRYDEILSEGLMENRATKPKWAKREETALLNRLVKYRDNHLLFLKNFNVAFTNNMSERDLRKCKNRQKVSGGFRNMEGCRMFADILSLIETAKKQKYNPYDVILGIFRSDNPAFSFCQG